MSLDINTVPWIVVYGVLSVCTILCNLFFLFVFFKSRRLRRMRTNFFLIGLTATDFIVGAVAIPFFMAILWPGWEETEPKAFTRSYEMIEIASSFASLFLVAAIALERVYSVFWPYKHRALSKTPYYLALFTSWFLAVLQMTLYLLQRYNFIAFSVFAYCMLPCMVAIMIIIVVSYFAMWKKIKRSRMEGLCQSRVEQERKLGKTLAMLSAIFLIALIPFSVVSAVFHLCTCSYKVSFPVVLASKFLHYSNSLANPVLYSFRFPEVRRTSARIFCGP